jgi:RNA polymerase sigma-70 factor (ECF subfamily)
VKRNREPLEPTRDDEVFGRLVERQRAAVHSHCYRILGSRHDAEDAFQETMLRAWRALPRFQGRSSVESWLYRIATNVCIDAIDRRPARTGRIGGHPHHARDPHTRRDRLRGHVSIEQHAGEDLAIEDESAAPHASYERRESVELAMIAALQRVPARQRAVLLLREVLGFSASETAAILGTTVASVNSALQRARRTVDSRMFDRSEHPHLRSIEDPRLRDLAARYTDAFERDDVDAILALVGEESHGAEAECATSRSGGGAGGPQFRGWLSDVAAPAETATPALR